jgi:hypothetical protein
MNAKEAIIGVWKPMYMVLPQNNLRVSTVTADNDVDEENDGQPPSPTPDTPEARSQRLRAEPWHQQHLPRPLEARFELELFEDGTYEERFLGSDHLTPVSQQRFSRTEQEYGFPEEREPLCGTWTLDETSGCLSLSRDPRNSEVERFHEGGFRDSALLFDWFSLLRHCEYCDYSTVSHIAVYVRTRATEETLWMEQSEMVQALRHLLSREPSVAVWEALCWHVQCWEGTEWSDFAVDYILSHTSQWPAEVCLLPWFWFRRLLDGRSFPGLRMIRSMERERLREFEIDILLGCNELVNLESLSLAQVQLHSFDVQEFLECPLVCKPRHLRLDRFDALGDQAAYTLAGASHLSHLETLELANFRFSDEAWSAIEQSPHFARTKVTLHREYQSLVEYDYEIESYDESEIEEWEDEEY